SLSACLPRWCVKVAPFPLQFALRQREHPCAPLHSSRSPIRGSELEQEASSCWPLQFCSSPKSQTGARLTSSSAQCPAGVDLQIFSTLHQAHRGAICPPDFRGAG